MSTTETNDTDDADDEQHDEPRYLTKYEHTIAHDLGDGLRLTIAGDLDHERPFTVTLVDDGSDVTGERFDADGLASEMPRRRFAERADRLVEPDVADGIEERLADLADAYVAGEVEVVDKKTIRVIEAAESVDHRPDMGGSEWRVVFRDPQSDAASEALLSASMWSDNPGGSLDRQLPSALRVRTFAAVEAGSNRDDRWRPVRRMLESMVAESGDE